MDDFFEVTVEFEVVLDNEKVKKSREYYLVLADSISYAEAQTTKLLKGLHDWSVISVRKSKIRSVKTDLLSDVELNG